VLPIESQLFPQEQVLGDQRPARTYGYVQESEKVDEQLLKRSRRVAWERKVEVEAWPTGLYRQAGQK